MSNAAATTAFCSICCEDNKISLFHLSTCSCNSSCKECLVRWIQKEETSGTTSPTCPFCRLILAEEDTCQILGRAFEPRTTVPMNGGDEEELDDLTQHWLDQHTQSCPSCHSRIQKASSQDCNLMECLCGYRFCFSCGCGGECRCQVDVTNHGYWDNVLQRYSDRSLPSSVAPADVQTGLVDLKRHIKIRKEEEQARRNNMLARISNVDGQRNNSNKEQEEEHLFLFTQVLLKYLERNDPQIHARAKDVLKRMKNKNKDLDAIRSSLYLAVGERYWTRAQFYHNHVAMQLHAFQAGQQYHAPLYAAGNSMQQSDSRHAFLSLSRAPPSQQNSAPPMVPLATPFYSAIVYNYALGFGSFR